MPKRPCAIVVTPDDSTILCADKFGDVYSLPLTRETSGLCSARSTTSDGMHRQSHKASHSGCTPSATSLTVHTKGNREALRQQQEARNRKVEKRSSCFECQLLLGHVSLLTDIICATAVISDFPQHYILTSDRDEHIRISRGIPQAHIIENYCLGHTEFVSKLRILPAYPHLLLSGGGDDYLLLWNWRSGFVQQKIDLRGHVDSLKEQYKTSMATKLPPGASEGTATENDSSEGKIAVTNIVSMDSVSEVIITCEKYVLYSITCIGLLTACIAYLLFSYFLWVLMLQ